MLEEDVRVFDVFDDQLVALSSGNGNFDIPNRSGTSSPCPLRRFESEPSTKSFARWFVFADPLMPHFKTMINQPPSATPPNKKIDSTGLHSILFCCLSVGIVLKRYC